LSRGIPRRCSGSGLDGPGVCANHPALYRVGHRSYLFYANIISRRLLNDNAGWTYKKRPRILELPSAGPLMAFFTANIAIITFIIERRAFRSIGGPKCCASSGIALPEAPH